jgi:SSS family solute:Na+ symporter
MHWLDWTILFGTLGFIVGYGVWRTRRDNSSESYLRGGGDERWWAVGLSVMATQASAITFLSTPGQGYLDGLGFVQFYFGLPLAMLVINRVFIPLYYKWKVYTAYEFIGKRFDARTRLLTAGSSSSSADWRPASPSTRRASSSARCCTGRLAGPACSSARW